VILRKCVLKFENVQINREVIARNKKCANLE
jgi:DNA-binding transcriptional regulator WhiA